MSDGGDGGEAGDDVGGEAGAIASEGVDSKVKEEKRAESEQHVQLGQPAQQGQGETRLAIDYCLLNSGC